MSKVERLALYQEILEDLGIKSIVDGDGDLSFLIEAEGQLLHLFLRLSDDNPYYLCLAWPAMREVESESEGPLLATVANHVNSSCDCAKITLGESRTHFHLSVETMFKDPRDLAVLFEPLLTQLVKAEVIFTECVALSKNPAPKKLLQ